MSVDECSSCGWLFGMHDEGCEMGDESDQLQRGRPNRKPRKLRGVHKSAGVHPVQGPAAH